MDKTAFLKVIKGRSLKAHRDQCDGRNDLLLLSQHIMQVYAETASKAVAEVEYALRTLVDAKEPDFEGLESLLEQLRKHCQDYVFLVFPTSTVKSAEDRLWDAHVRVNKKFQKHLKQFREGSGKKKHVERRKAEKQYLGFIKASMHFYRGYIQRLASHFGNVPEVTTIAEKLHLDVLSAEHRVGVKPEQKDGVLASCHSALMRLGDLSRYRETELETKNRNWGPAKGHYQLALLVKPESGAAYNQLAVMALADDDHLRAVYYLHRAATTTRPFPVAHDNIKLEFDKLLKLEPEEKSAIADTSKQTLEVLENRFLAFHANCHSRPSDFVTYSIKVTQMLQLITVSFEEIKDRSLDKLLQKMCLISIAAEHLAWKGVLDTPLDAEVAERSRSEKDKKVETKRIAEHDRNCQAVYLLQRLNILTFTTLLKVLARELSGENEELEGQDQILAIVASPVRRLLPHLRQYSSWLLSNIHSLLNPRHTSTRKCLEQFWKAYVMVANLLLTKYHIAEVHDADYLLEEDEDTLAFAPFSHNIVLWRYHFDNGPCKPTKSSKLQDNSFNAEMLARIRRFVFDAATITNQKEKLKIDWAPIALVQGEFVFEDKKPAVITIEKPSTPSQPFRSRAHAHANSMNGISPVASPKPVRLAKEDDDPNVLAGAQYSQLHEDVDDVGNQAVKMGHMVAETVIISNEHVDLSSGRPPSQNSLLNSSSLMAGTPNAAQTSRTIMDIVRGMQQTTPKPPQTDTVDVIRGMQQGSSEPLSPPLPNTAIHHTRLSNPSIPGIWSTAFTPRPGETPAAAPRPGTSSGNKLSSHPQSSTLFNQEIGRQERDIQMRTSPYHPGSSSSWQEPQHSTSLSQQQPWNTASRSPWQSPSTRMAEPQQRSLPQAALFGVIGEPRRNDSRSPRSED